ncbi:Heat shock 70 kDa protein 12B [Lachnellula subtilissima]|uniref:Heat shock 70 kDa protein 12B n=1 Tax=Lachnellula subtilissima TaxID=602034 RepID=A0A8H8RHV1_9HELO|nr:Heat shock 70 kDa protein 12B [Lachnellula subtilissima]
MQRPTSKLAMEAFEDMQGMTTSYESEDQLIVALDFGTTFSGIAYAFANGDKPEVVSIMDWPGLEGFKQPKIPTLISYDDNGDFTWGGQKHKSDVVQGVKLLLDPDQPRPLYLPESTAKSDLKRLDKPPVKVVADFIRAMYQHSLSKIESAVPAQYLSMCQKQFVLTVPAVWSDKAKDTTLQAAKEAGLHPVTMIKEPEAAAMYTLHTLQDRALAVGDAFVICDAGGGTVDLISYEITQLKPTLELKELVPGKGGMAGSLGLNQRFEGAQFDRSVKTAFRNDLYEDYLINFPLAELKDDVRNNLKVNCWNMTSADVKAIFDPLITDIQRLVEEQVNLVKVKRMSEDHPKANEIKAIFLVGGFGSSEYLKSQLEQDHSTIQIIQPHGAWAAIVKGAVLSQLPEEASIVSSQATRHYGVSARHVFDPRTDQGQPQHYDPVTGKTRVLTMTWYIHRGDDLIREQSITFPFFRSLVEGFTDDRLVFCDELIQSEKNIAPRHPSTSANKVNCVLTADLSKVDRSLFKKVMGTDGRNYVQVFYDLVVTMKPAVMKFSLEIKGEEMGSVSAKF